MERIINILADANLLGTASNTDDGIEITLGELRTASDVERLAWAVQEFSVFNAPAGGVEIDIEEFTKALFTPSFCAAWLVVGLAWSPLKHGGLVSSRLVRERALSMCAESKARGLWTHAGRALLAFADQPDRRHTVQPWVRTWGEWQDFFDHIGERYECVYCMNNHECMVKGCTRRPSDSFCNNYNVRGKTFRFEFRHQDDGLGGKIHACGKCAKSMLYFKRELVTNWGKSKASWSAGKTRRKPREHAFHKCELKDGRVYHIERCGDRTDEPAPWCLMLLKHAEHNPRGDLIVKNLESNLRDNGLDKAKKAAAIKAERDRKAAEERARKLEEQRAQLARIREREERERVALEAEYERRRVANIASRVAARRDEKKHRAEAAARIAAKEKRLSQSLRFIENFFQSRRYNNNINTNRYTGQ
jgi:hypothetical protein